MFKDNVVLSLHQDWKQPLFQRGINYTSDTTRVNFKKSQRTNTDLTRFHG